MKALGISDDLYKKMQSTVVSLDPLEHDTSLYRELYIALRILGMTYSSYISQVSKQERIMYKLFFFMEAEKERHAEEIRESKVKNDYSGRMRQ